MTLNIKTNVVVDLPCTYSNNHLTTTAGTQSSVWLEFLTAALMWNCRHLLNPVNFGNSETICCCAGQFFFIPPSFLSSRTLAACFSPRPVHHLWVSPLVLLQHPFMLSPLSLSLCNTMFCWLMPAETVARVSCTTVSMATSWQCHLPKGHITAQSTGQP